MDSIFYQKAFGKLNKESGIDFTTHSVIPIGSITKTLPGIAILKTVELDYLSLDDDTNKYLSFKVINPYHPDKKITLRHLTTHTSTLTYTRHYDKVYIFDNKIPPFYNDFKGKKKEIQAEIDTYNSKVNMTMEELIQKIYVVGGEWYTNKNFLSNSPDEKYSYCNENATKQDYKSFIDEHIVSPMKMTSSGWSMSEYDNKDKGQLYLYKNPLPNYNLITYPNGGFVTNIVDFTNYFQDIIRGYYGEGSLLA